ncbi:unnamed protein product [Linum tenue]|uniref:Retrotransposon gag domain-containing protein n=1 Tax=Linum tenue TaxID=586396 RepID=A0AAV0IEC4_9ROSI|nr:unnamed protein product [Linum tenue]
MEHMPRYAKYLKGLLAKKPKFEDLANVTIGEECSAFILNKLPKKQPDPGASINVMPYKLFRKLHLDELKTTRLSVILVDCSAISPIDSDMPLKLGRPFLATGKALINVNEGTLILRDGEEQLTLSIDPKAKNDYVKEMDSSGMIRSGGAWLIRSSFEILKMPCFYSVHGFSPIGTAWARVWGRLDEVWTVDGKKRLSHGLTMLSHDRATWSCNTLLRGQDCTGRACAPFGRMGFPETSHRLAEFPQGRAVLCMTRSQSGDLLPLDQELERTCHNFKRALNARLAAEEALAHININQEEEMGEPNDGGELVPDEHTMRYYWTARAEGECPRSHLRRFHELIDGIMINGVPTDAFQLRCFPFTLDGQAKEGLDTRPPGSIIAFAGVGDKFLTRYHPPSKTGDLQKEITHFAQEEDETIRDAWERYSSLFLKCPNHGFNDAFRVGTFYRALFPEDKQLIDWVCGGNMMTKTPL